MKTNTRKLISLISLSLATHMLPGCGGGGGDGGGTLLDTDGDGLSNQDEINLYHTSPTLADTDGDGFSDGDEIKDKGFDPANNNYQFNPLIADTPRLSISVTSEPDIDVHYTETNGSSVSRGTSHTDETTSTLITNFTTSNGTKIEDTHELGGEVELSKEGILAPTVNYSFKNVTTRENTSQWSKTKVDEHLQIYSEAVEYANNHEIATSGGSLSYTIKVKNEGHVAFTLTNLSLTALAGQPTMTELFEPVANLDLDTSFASYPATTIGPGASTGNLLFSKGDLDTATVLDLFRDSSGLVTEVATFDVLDENGVSYVQRETDIAARTAMIFIDYAPGLDRAPESYAIATNGDPDNPGITVRQALTDILNIPYAVEAEHLTAVRGITTTYTPDSRWLVLTVTGDDVNREATTYDDASIYDFDNLQLKAGDVLHLVHVADTDDDGLANRQELLYYTDPTLPDTDGDGLTDLDETQGFPIMVNGIEQIVYSNPTRTDDDNDGLTDTEELTSLPPTNPRERDTDHDQLSDAEDPHPVDANKIDITDIQAVATTSGSPNISLTWTVSDDSSAIAYATLWLYYRDPGDGSDIPEAPVVAPSDGVIYEAGDDIGGWTVLIYEANEAPSLTFNRQLIPPAGTTGTYKFISYVDVDLNNDRVGDRYLRSVDSNQIPWAVDTDTFEVTITGLDLRRCVDYVTVDLFGPAIDPFCEPYWNFKVNGTPLPGGSLAKSDAVAVGLSGRVRSFSNSAAFETLRPRTDGACIYIQGDIADADDSTTSTSGDEHGRFTRTPVCYDARIGDWVGLQANPDTPYAFNVTLSGGKYGWYFIDQGRTTYRVFYTVRKCAASGC